MLTIRNLVGRAGGLGWALGTVLLACASGCGDDNASATGQGGSGGDTSSQGGAGGSGANANGGQGGTSNGGNGGSGGAVSGPCTETLDSATVGVGDGFTPNIITTPTGFALVATYGGEVYAHLLSETGVVTASAQVSTAAGNARLPTIAYDGSTYRVVWAQGMGVYTRALNAAGAPSGPSTLVTMTTSTEPRPNIAGTGNADELRAAWMQSTGSTAALLDGHNISESDTVDGFFPAVAMQGSTVGVAWSDGANDGPITFATADDLTSTVTVNGSSALIKDLTASDTAFYMVWEDVSGSVEQIGAARIVGTAVGTGSVAPAGSSANWPAAAWTGTQLAVAYYQFRSGPASVFLTFLEEDLSPTNIELELAQDAKYASVAVGHGVVAVAYNLDPGPVQLSFVTCTER